MASGITKGDVANGTVSRQTENTHDFMEIGLMERYVDCGWMCSNNKDQRKHISVLFTS